jgi:hypothetical protein
LRTPSSSGACQTARRLSLGAFLALIGSLAVFFAYTYPINALTQSSTVAPENLEMARRQWEYSHANAGFVLLALVLIVSAVPGAAVQAQWRIRHRIRGRPQPSPATRQSADSEAGRVSLQAARSFADVLVEKKPEELGSASASWHPVGGQTSGARGLTP